MSEMNREKREQDWGDQIPQDNPQDEYEKTYRDGSAVNECWAQEKENV